MAVFIQAGFPLTENYIPRLKQWKNSCILPRSAQREPVPLDRLSLTQKEVVCVRGPSPLAKTLWRAFILNGTCAVERV